MHFLLQTGKKLIWLQFLLMLERKKREEDIAVLYCIVCHWLHRKYKTKQHTILSNTKLLETYKLYKIFFSSYGCLPSLPDLDSNETA